MTYLSSKVLGENAILYLELIVFMRVHFPKGSIDPKSGLLALAPLGGVGFKEPQIYGGTNCAFLTYQLKFSNNFDWGYGGKLPGLYGGGNSSGNIPNGLDGFSTRYTWKEEGKLVVYAYLPTSLIWDTSFGNGKRFSTVGNGSN